MRSAEAAKNTATLIEESVKNADTGVAINHEVLKNLEEIGSQVRKVTEVMAEITAASDQQSQGINQINMAVEQMNQVTQTTAANAEESASAAEELAGQAAEMRSMVRSFHLNEITSNESGTHARSNKPSALPPGLAQQRTKCASNPKRQRHNGGAPGGETNAKKLIPFEDTDSTVLNEF